MKKSVARDVGYISSFFSGVAKIEGLWNVFIHEVLIDAKDKPIGIVIGFTENFVEALLFDEDTPLDTPLFRSQKPFSIPISQDYIGRVVDGVAQSLDGLENPKGSLSEVFREAPGIFDRQPVTEPLSTGIKIIDATLPLGRGQKELIIGDRKLGKSTMVKDIVLNQKNNEKPVYCVYVLCGQKSDQLTELIDLFEKNNAFSYSTIVCATSDASFASQYLAPFVGCRIGEYFRDKGKDALVIYDDLSKHAKIYRDIALLLGRAPGREAYPGDIFSLHAGLLERAAKLSTKRGGGSVTALPIIETQEGDITSFIPTNIISITDGQIYLERGLFQKGFLPAVNVGLSVSRVGAAAQPQSLRATTEGLRITLSQQNELQKLTQLETTISTETQKNIYRGQLTLELLKQEKHTNVTWPEQTLLFYAVEKGYFDDLKKEQWGDFQNYLLLLLRTKYGQVLSKMKTEKLESFGKEVAVIVADFKNEFMLTL